MSTSYDAVQKISRSNRNTQARSIHPIRHEDSTIHDPTKISDLFASHLLQVNNEDPASGPHANRREPWPVILHSPLTRDDIRQALAMLKSKRTPGPDGVTSELLRAGGEPIVEWLFSVLEPIWENEVGHADFPTVLADTTIIPILKGNKNPEELDSYRPISLTSVILKCLEEIILRRIQTDFSARLGSYPSGFVRDRQLSEHILSLRILSEQAKANQERFYAVFMDLIGAYDRVDRPRLFEVLKDLDPYINK